MSETVDFEKTQKSKQYLKITRSKTTHLEKNLKEKNGIRGLRRYCLDFGVFFVIALTQKKHKILTMLSISLKYLG